MVSCTFTKDEFGNNVAHYSNSYTFTGSYDTDGKPANGIIKDEQGNLVYEGEIKYDIYEYFQQYQSSGKTIKAK